MLNDDEHDAHLQTTEFHDTDKVVTNEHGETYRKQIATRESIYCRVKRTVLYFRWVRVKNTGQDAE